MRSARSRNEEPLIIVDSREQRPLEFPRSVTRALRTGDYSIAGYADHTAIERKSKADAYSSVGAHRGRFHRRSSVSRRSTIPRS